MDRRIRILALALIRRGDRILVEKGRDEVKDETFFRPLGGTVEFGERGADALRRELVEELATDVDVGPLVATIENVYMFEGDLSHELVLVYDCSLGDERLHALEEWDARETTADGVLTHKIAWRDIDSLRGGDEILYPEELLSLKQLQ